jgi:hypothetical protein
MEDCWSEVKADDEMEEEEGEKRRAYIGKLMGAKIRHFHKQLEHHMQGRCGCIEVSMLCVR